MKLRGIFALALMLACAPALAQVTPGTSPLSGAKGGTNNAFMQFTGPATSMKTYTLANASDTIALLGQIQTWTGAQSFTDGTVILLGSGSGSSTLKAPATGGGTATLFPGTDTIEGVTSAQTPTNKTFVCASQVSCVVRIGTDVSGLGTGVATALGVNVGSAGAVVVNGGALGAPSSGVGTNITGLPISTGLSGAGTGVLAALGNPVGGAGGLVPTSQVATNAAKGIMQGDGSTINCVSGSCSAIGAISIGVVPTWPQGRITLTPGTAITTTDVGGATAHLYTPAPGSYLPITTDGVNFTMTQFWEMSQATADTVKSPAAVANSSVYDILGWQDSSTITVTAASPAVVTWTANGFRVGAEFSCTTAGGSPPVAMPDNTPFFVISAGLGANSFEFALTAGGSAVNTASTGTGTRTCTTIRATRGPAWTSDTNRGTGAGTSEVDFTTKFPTNKNAVTNGPAANKGLVLGSVRSNASAQLMDTAAFRWVSNAYLCDSRKLAVVESGTLWNYSSTTYHQANGNAADQLDFLQTFAGNQLTAHITASYSNTLTSVIGTVGIDIDTLNTTSIVNNINTASYTKLANAVETETADYNDYPGLGRHIAIWKENSIGGGTGTYYGTGGGTNFQAGIYGSICN